MHLSWNCGHLSPLSLSPLSVDSSSYFWLIVWSRWECLLHLYRIFCLMAPLPQEKRLNATALLQLGCCWVLLGTSECKYSRIWRYVSHLELGRRERRRSPTRDKRRACMRAITVHGIVDDVEVSIALKEYLIVMVNTNAMRCALQESRLKSFEKKKKPLHIAKNERCYIPCTLVH